MDSLKPFSMSLSSYLSLRIHSTFFTLPGINFHGFLYSGLFVNPCTKSVLCRHLHISSQIRPPLLEDSNNAGQRAAHIVSLQCLPKTSLPIMLAVVNISSGLTNHYGPDRLESSTKWPTLPETGQLLLRSQYRLLTLLRADFVILRCKSQRQDCHSDASFQKWHIPLTWSGQALMYLLCACLWSQQVFLSFLLPAHYSHWQLGDQDHSSLPYTRSVGLGAATTMILTGCHMW